jgi:hypothetical protein
MVFDPDLIVLIFRLDNFPIKLIKFLLELFSQLAFLLHLSHLAIHLCQMVFERKYFATFRDGTVLRAGQEFAVGGNLAPNIAFISHGLFNLSVNGGYVALKHPFSGLLVIFQGECDEVGPCLVV